MFEQSSCECKNGGLVSKSLFQVCETKMQKEFKRIMWRELQNFGKKEKVQKMQQLNGSTSSNNFVSMLSTFISNTKSLVG